MGIPTLPLHTSDEQVAVAWIGSIPDIITIGGTRIVATKLPPDANANGSPASWVPYGFVTVGPGTGGDVDQDVPVNRPILQVDCWATKPGSEKPPWWMAAALGSAIRYACWQRTGFNRELSISAGGVAYPSAVVQAAELMTPFRRAYADQAGYARYTGDLGLSWITVGDHID